jgi:hypothetical protein
MKSFKALVILVTLSFSVSVFANNWGFYADYNVEQTMPQQQSNGSYTFPSNQGPSSDLFAGIKSKFNEVKDRVKANSEARRSKRYARQASFYACLQAGTSRKECRKARGTQGKSDRQGLRADRKSKRLSRLSTRRNKRIGRKLARLEKRRQKLLSRYNGN